MAWVSILQHPWDSYFSRAIRSVIDRSSRGVREGGRPIVSCSKAAIPDTFNPMFISDMLNVSLNLYI